MIDICPESAASAWRYFESKAANPYAAAKNATHLRAHARGRRYREADDFTPITKKPRKKYSEPKHYPPSLIDAVRRDYAAGVPICTISRTHRLGNQTVYKLLRGE